MAVPSSMQKPIQGQITRNGRSKLQLRFGERLQKVEPSFYTLLQSSIKALEKVSGELHGLFALFQRCYTDKYLYIQELFPVEIDQVCDILFTTDSLLCKCTPEIHR